MQNYGLSIDHSCSALLRKRHKVPSDNGKNPCIIAAPY